MVVSCSLYCPVKEVECIKEKETVLSRDSHLCTALRCFCGKCTTPTALFAVPNRSLRSRNRLLPKPLATAGDSITICVFDLCVCVRVLDGTSFPLIP